MVCYDLLVAAYCLLLTSCYLLLTAYYSLLATHCLLLATRRDSREKGGKQKGQRQGGMGGMGGMGGLMMMGGGGEAGQGYNKQNPYAYGEPPRIDPPHPTPPMRLGCSPSVQAAAHVTCRIAVTCGANVT